MGPPACSNQSNAEHSPYFTLAEANWFPKENCLWKTLSCHISPQGGGLLNLYGRGIDQAQSMVGGEYTPWQSRFSELLNMEGRITQDVRSMIRQSDVSTTGKPGTQTFRSRFIYRNATELGRGVRLTGTITGENTKAPRPSLAYNLPAKPAQLFVNTALLSYRMRPTLEMAAGRDQLPVGVNISDLSTSSAREIMSAITTLPRRLRSSGGVSDIWSRLTPMVRAATNGPACMNPAAVFWPNSMYSISGGA
jgi:hypothetical protein